MSDNTPVKIRQALEAVPEQINVLYECDNGMDYQPISMIDSEAWDGDGIILPNSSVAILLGNAKVWLRELLEDNQRLQHELEVQRRAAELGAKGMVECTSQLEDYKAQLHAAVAAGCQSAENSVHLSLALEAAEAHNALLQAQLDAKDTEIAKKDEFFREWASGEDKFQAFGGWERIERLQHDHKAMWTALSDILGNTDDEGAKDCAQDCLQSLKEPNT